MAEMTVITQETLSVSGIMLAKLFGRQHEEMANFRRHNQELSDLTIRQQMIGHAFFAVVMAFLSASPVAIYLLAGYLMAGGGPAVVSPGDVIAFTVLQNRLYFPVGRLLQVAVELQSSLAMFERIFGYLDMKQEIVDSSQCATPGPGQGQRRNCLRRRAGQLPRGRRGTLGTRQERSPHSGERGKRTRLGP